MIKLIQMLFVVTILFYIIIYTSLLALKLSQADVTIVSLPYETHVISKTAAESSEQRKDPNLSHDKNRQPCWNFSFPGKPDDDNTWHFVDKNKTVLVFSAYSVNTSKIVVIGAGTDLWTKTFVVLLWYEPVATENFGMDKSPCVVNPVGEDHGRK